MPAKPCNKMKDIAHSKWHPIFRKISNIDEVIKKVSNQRAASPTTGWAIKLAYPGWIKVMRVVVCGSQTENAIQPCSHFNGDE